MSLRRNGDNFLLSGKISHATMTQEKKKKEEKNVYFNIRKQENAPNCVNDY